MDAKRELRREMRARLASIQPAEVTESRAAIGQMLLEWPRLALCEGLLCFAPFGGEVSPESIASAWLHDGKAVYFPKVSNDQVTLHPWQIMTYAALVPGYRGILEPDDAVCRRAAWHEIDVVLVPGLAFDRKGTRLGRGGGHYDRLLARVPESALRLALAWDWQIVPSNEEIPREDHDAVMDYICTPTSLIRCKPGRRG